jgi:hypothetical protein
MAMKIETLISSKAASIRAEGRLFDASAARGAQITQAIVLAALGKRLAVAMSAGAMIIARAMD